MCNNCVVFAKIRRVEIMPLTTQLFGWLDISHFTVVTKVAVGFPAHKRIQLSMQQCSLYFCPILTKNEICKQILIKFLTVKFNGNQFNQSRTFRANGWKGGQCKDNIRTFKTKSTIRKSQNIMLNKYKVNRRTRLNTSRLQQATSDGFVITISGFWSAEQGIP